MMLVIQTQNYENYAWVDGEIQTGSGAYWKAKGGSEFKITNIPYPCDVEEIVSLVRHEIERADDYYIVDIVGYNVEPDNYLSWFERSQLEYDGEIQFPEPEIDYEELVDCHHERGYN